MKTKNMLTALMILVATLFLSVDAWSYTAKDLSQVTITINQINYRLKSPRNSFQKANCQRALSNFTGYQQRLKETLVGLHSSPGPAPTTLGCLP